MVLSGYRSQKLLKVLWVLLAVVVLTLYVRRELQYSWEAKDFTMFLTGSHIVASGQGANLYNLDTQAAVQAPLAKGVEFPGGVLPFNYPPYIAMMLSPLALIHPDVAYYTWITIQWGLLLGLAYAIWSYCRKRASGSGGAMLPVLMIFSFVPVFESLLMGQMSLVLLALWWLMFVSWKAERWGWVGAAVALAAFKPQMALLPFAGLVAERRWKACIYAVSVTAALWALAVLLWGPGLFVSYVQMLWLSASTTDSFGFVPAVMINLRGLLTNVGISAEVARLVGMGAWLLSIVGCVLVWRALWPVTRKFCLMVLLAVLFSPHLYLHDTSLLLLAAVCLYIAYLEEQVPLQTGWLLLAFSLICVLTYVFLQGVANSWPGVIVSVWLLGCIILALLLRLPARATVASVGASAAIRD